MLKIQIANIDHVSVPVSEANLQASIDFYANTLGLTEITRPEPLANAMRGAWFRVDGDPADGGRTIHLIADANSTFRKATAEKQLSSRDTHFALRISNFAETVELLLEKGHTVNTKAGRLEMKVSATSLAGFPQIFLMDPDRNVIELNAKPLQAGELEPLKKQLKALGVDAS